MLPADRTPFFPTGTVHAAGAVHAVRSSRSSRGNQADRAADGLSGTAGDGRWPFCAAASRADAGWASSTVRGLLTVLLLVLVPPPVGRGQTVNEQTVNEQAVRGPADSQRRPNLIWVMADDLGYGELGCYGQQVIQTPHLDQMAAEGLRFSQFYAGATVCAPSRSVLNTGLHHGHTPVRGNAGRRNPAAQALRDDDMTVAKMLQSAGYRTALIGKWGLGDEGGAESGLPHRQGFDSFFGYLNQSHAHNHFPNFLWRNQQKVSLPNEITPIGDVGAGYAENGLLYADDLLADEALKFIANYQDQPFYLYWSLVIPHANNERNNRLKDGAHVPDYGRYAQEDWPAPDKGHAAMISRMDSYLGRLLGRLRELDLHHNTIVVFTSDNGPHNESSHDLSRFQPSGPFSGIKRSLTDGGIRVPCLVWAPGLIAAGQVSPHVAYFGDWMATAADLAGIDPPAGLDSISFAPTLRGQSDGQAQHQFLYWEFHERGFKQAVLYQGRWKGHRQGDPKAPLQLFDLTTDPAEQHDLAADHPQIVAAIDHYLTTARSENANWMPLW